MKFWVHGTVLYAFHLDKFLREESKYYFSKESTFYGNKVWKLGHKALKTSDNLKCPRYLNDITAAAKETPATELKLGSWERKKWMEPKIKIQ